MNGNLIWKRLVGAGASTQSILARHIHFFYTATIKLLMHGVCVEAGLKL